MSAASVRAAGDAALLLELESVIDPEVNARAVAIAHALRAACMPGVRDVVPAFHSVAVYLDPLTADVPAVESVLRQPVTAATDAPRFKTTDVPVAYGGDFGPDLPDVAAFAGLAQDEVVRLHAGRPYRVYMLGFLPGFPYLGTVDERIAAPRRGVPRTRVPAGSVGIASRQTGIYPRDSPGGWQIIGRTDVRLFDPARTPATLLAPGDTVRFVPLAPEALTRRPQTAVDSSGTQRIDETASTDATRSRRVTVLQSGLLTTVQDLGRWGHQSSGVPVAGPLDPFSHRLANALVGNPRDAALLEITLAGPELLLEDDAALALTGADLSATLNGTPMPMNETVTARAGSLVRFGVRRRGARTYLAFDGGVAAPLVLGSRATHVRSGMGGPYGRALRSGDSIPLGPLQPALRRRTAPRSAAVGDVSIRRIRVMPGPQEASPAAIDLLTRSRFEVSPASDRMGYRLSGEALPADVRGTMISTSTFTGAIQLPPSGEPVLLMADRQTTGGYPQIATVITADLPSAGQLAPGDAVEFQLCSRREALSALVRQEGLLLALE